MRGFVPMGATADRHPYDATYVALAEGLGCRLATSDLRLANAPGPDCEIQVVHDGS